MFLDDCEVEVNLQYRVNGANKLNLDFILFGSNIVGAVVNMDASILGAQPHGGLVLLIFNGWSVVGGCVAGMFGG